MKSLTGNRRIARSPLLYFSLAAIASVITALSIVAYTSGVERRVLRDLEPVQVLVASEQILPGVTLQKAIEQGLTEVTQFPAKATPKGAILPTEQSLLDHEAAVVIDPGQVLLASSFPAATNEKATLKIPDGLLATTIEVSIAAKVGSFLRPYDYVVVYVTPRTNTAQRAETSVLLPKALVLAVGENTARGSKNADAERTETVTLGLSPSDSLRLVAGLKAGDIYLGLLTATTDPFEK